MRLALFVFVLFFTVSSFAQDIRIIPQPVSLQQGGGVLTIQEPVAFIYNADVPHDGGVAFFKQYLQQYYNIKQFRGGNTHSYGLPTEIFIDYAKEMAGEKYELIVDTKKITVRGNEKGLFYAFQTLIQLLSLQGSSLQVPVCTITDYPRFQYRGMHLDVSRHFFPVAFIKKYIDYLALHKLNTFHWHLTDDQGWRIEIKKYPKLTSVGAYRNGTIIGRYPGSGSDNKPYGGFYTQDEIREVVQYAADRFITVIPEIEMPGHGSAAIAAYPWLSCFPGEGTVIPDNMISARSKALLKQNKGQKLVQETWGVFDDVFCAGKDATFSFLQDVLDEVIPLFPSRYIHIGGDECPKENWKRCPACQQRMKNGGLKDEHELQSYFIQRMEKYVNSKGKTIIGWDEILEGGLAPNAIVMSWRGEEGGIAAAKQQHYVIMTPGNPVYFDHTQSRNEDSVTIGGYNPIENVYAYEPIPAELTAEEGNYILGAQANLWAEYLEYPSKVEYMLFPRLAALSEIVWSPKDKRNWEDFEKRLPVQLKRYELWKAHYSKEFFKMKTKVSPTDNFNGINWVISKGYNEGTLIFRRFEEFSGKDTQAIYTTSHPAFFLKYEVHDSPWWRIQRQFSSSTANLLIKQSGLYDISNLKIRPESGDNMFLDPDYPVITIETEFRFNKATGKQITLTHAPSKKYPGDGAFTLVNGVQNEKGMAKSDEYLGFDGTDCEAIIDLGKKEIISSVTVHALHDAGSWIWKPYLLEVFLSGNGTDFTSAGVADDFIPGANGNGIMTRTLEGVSARYIKVKVQNQGAIPAGNPGAGSRPWLFVDEIEVN